jgi:hypothetical protein
MLLHKFLLTSEYLNKHEVFGVQKQKRKRTKYKQLNDTRASHRALRCALSIHGAGFQVTSHSSGSPLDHANLPQHSQYSVISSAYN